MRTGLVVLVVALAAVAASGQGTSQGSTGPAATLHGTGRAALALEPVEHVPGTAAGGHRPVVAIDDDGTATVVWRQTHRSADGVERSVLRTARRGIGGRWSRVHDLRCGGDRCGGEYPSIGVDAAGDVTMVWADGTSVLAARRPAGAGRGWTRPRVIAHSTHPLDRYARPSLAVARNGRVFVAWAGEDAVVRVVQRPAHGPWRAPFTLGPGYRPSVGASPAGSAVVAWWVPGRIYRSVWTARFVAGRGWRSPQRLGGGDFPTVAVGSRGQALAAWGSNNGGRIRTRLMTAGGRWHNPGSVPTTWGWIWDLAAAIDRAGRDFCAWLDDSDTGDPQDGLLATRAPGGTWSRTMVPRASATRHGSRALLSVNRRNDVAVIFTDRIVLRPHGSRWTRPARVGARAGGILPGGSALRLWWGDSGLDAQRVHVR